MEGKIVVIEGLDGAGKSTQIELLKTQLEIIGIDYKYIHFPMLNQGKYGELIAEFLRGEYGTVKDVHPKLVAVLFANDRKEHLKKINQWLHEGYFVLMDRYVNSNIAFQCAKVEDKLEKEKLKKWILELEYNYNKLPLPFISFFLNVSLNFISRSLSNVRDGREREYLNGKQDIHERSLTLQEKVHKEYLTMLTEQNKFICIDCCDENNYLLTPEHINKKIMAEIKTSLYLN
jgi:dTMP kinase